MRSVEQLRVDRAEIRSYGRRAQTRTDHLKLGHATASPLVGKLSATNHHETLPAALKECGALRRTIYAVKYLSEPDYRRRISCRLNKDESLHALRRDLLCAHEGRIPDCQLAEQRTQAWNLTWPPTS